MNYIRTDIFFRRCIPSGICIFNFVLLKLVRGLTVQLTRYSVISLSNAFKFTPENGTSMQKNNLNAILL